MERLLLALGRRLRLLVLCHGLGTLLGVLALWITFVYFADWGLRVPKVVRIAHGAVWVGLGVVFLWRALLRPLGRVPDKKGLALLYERSHPELNEVLISALQFQEQGGASDGDAAMVARVLEEADRRAADLNPAGILDVRAPRTRFLLGLLATSLVVGFGFRRPDHIEILFNRMWGGSMGWPQATHLAISLPGIREHGTVEEVGDMLVARVARGTDVPIVVRAEGVVPDDVRLAFQDRQDLSLTKSGGDAFRTLLRSLQEDITFYATGGDDQDGLPLVRIEVLQPPDVTGIAFAVEPPAYSGLPARLVFEHEVDVLAGSEVRVHVLPSPADAIGNARLLPSEELVALEPLNFPVGPEGTDQGQAGDPPAASGFDGGGLSFHRRVDQSLGFRIELTDDSGLSNPDPALFRITAVEDRPPEISVLAPGRSDFEIVVGGAIPLRVRAEDDLGVSALEWSVLVGVPSEASETVLEGKLELISETAPGQVAEARAPKAALGAHLIEVDDLGTESVPVAVDQRFVLSILARDNRAPTANEQEALPIRARVVTPEELLRRMQERLARARLDAVRLLHLQQEKQRRVEELIDAFDGDGSAGSEVVALAAALSGQRRVLGDAEALGRELAAVAEDILYARLDDKAGALLDFYHQRASKSLELRFRSEPWRQLAAADAAGQLGSGGFASSLAQLVGLALELGEDHARAATLALDEAERALDAGKRIEALVRTVEFQQSCVTRIENLLEELAEWDNFQNVLALSRDLLNRQKALRDRTQRYASGK